MSIAGTAITWIAWNILLAVIPVGIAYMLAGSIEQFTLKGKTTSWMIWIPPALVWLAFLPNSCYLLTEWRHFLHGGPLLNEDGTRTETAAAISAARESLLYFAYSAIGALCFTLSIRPIHRVLRKAKWPVVPLAIPLFVFVSVGVYLGLVIRLNSWDAVLHPMELVHAIQHLLLATSSIKAVLIFAFVLMLMYVIVDMWVDGFQLRFKRSGAASSELSRSAG